MIRSAVRSATVVLVVAASGVGAGCIIFAGKAHVTSSGKVPLSAGGIALSVVFSHDFSADTPRSLGNNIVDCVTRGLTEAAPDVRVLAADDFHRLVFRVKPGGVLLRPDTITSLLSRPVSGRASRTRV
jgi:hypothetical protein